jgi:hypothetical protein
VSDTFKIVSPGLLVTKMSVDTGIPSSTRQTLSISERNVLSVRVSVALSQSKIDNVDVVLLLFAVADKEVVWLDIPMNNSFGMNRLDTLNHLNCHHQDGL